MKIKLLLVLSALIVLVSSIAWADPDPEWVVYLKTSYYSPRSTIFTCGTGTPGETILTPSSDVPIIAEMPASASILLSSDIRSPLAFGQTYTWSTIILYGDTQHPSFNLIGFRALIAKTGLDRSLWMLKDGQWELLWQLDGVSAKNDFYISLPTVTSENPYYLKFMATGVPEPGCAAALATGFMGLAVFRVKRRRI